MHQFSLEGTYEEEDGKDVWELKSERHREYLPASNPASWLNKFPPAPPPAISDVFVEWWWCYSSHFQTNKFTLLISK